MKPEVNLIGNWATLFPVQVSALSSLQLKSVLPCPPGLVSSLTSLVFYLSVLSFHFPSPPPPPHKFHFTD